MKIVFHPSVTKSVHLQLLHLRTFSLGRRPEGKDDFAVYLAVVSAAVRTGHESCVLYFSRVTLVAVFGAWVPPYYFEPILQLEQGASDDCEAFS